MAQQKPERLSVTELLRLVDQLSPEEKEEFQDELERQYLREAIEEGEESIRQHGTLDGEEVFASVLSELNKRKATE